MTPEPIDDLRARLRELGYLRHGIERWFALDPWSSRTFWQELIAVALKAATLVAAFVVLPMIAVMILRNRPLPLWEATVLAASYLLLAFAAITVLVVLTGLALKLRPSAAVERPRLLTALALLLAVVLCAGVGMWWGGFDGDSSTAEAATVAILVAILLAVATIVFSAALLSFSIHETGRIPVVARTSVAVPLWITGAATLVVLVAGTRELALGTPPEPPRQIAVRQTGARVAFIAADGLTRELFLARSDLPALFAQEAPAAVSRHRPAAEEWATVGTGTSHFVHGVRAVEGLRIARGERILQSVSRFEPLRTRAAEIVGVVRRQALPSTVRERDYVWEILASRGVSVVAVNWWVTPEGAGSVGQQTVFAAAAADDPAEKALAIDAAAIASLRRALPADPRFATVYLPALDILVNRIDLGADRRLALALAAIDRIAALVRELRAEGYDVILFGAPGEEQEAPGVVASTLPLDLTTVAGEDLAPTLLDLFGFPASAEMRGRSLVPGSGQGRVPSFGARAARAPGAAAPDAEYFEALRSLGYVQ